MSLRQEDQQDIPTLPDPWTEEASARTWHPRYCSVADLEDVQSYRFLIFKVSLFNRSIQGLNKMLYKMLWEC